MHLIWLANGQAHGNESQHGVVRVMAQRLRDIGLALTALPGQRSIAQRGHRFRAVPLGHAAGNPPSVTSRTQCNRFSIPQCACHTANTCAGLHSAGCSEVIAYARSLRTRRVALSVTTRHSSTTCPNPGQSLYAFKAAEQFTARSTIRLPTNSVVTAVQTVSLSRGLLNRS